ncbi:transglycosylase SLT domain-containing protein [Microbacterium sp. CJ88]|uniref:aggregation-promoting factor C-terminal-like domain-containing protein n=1 Tax=Microbacterium sp. CJ88 TaxID=3445672 RepID=UPI003F65B526
MTSGNEMTPASARRSYRALAAREQTVAPEPPRRAAAAPAPRWSRRRRVMGVFATVAVLGFAAAYVGPLSGSLMGASALEPAAVTLYASSMDDSQSFAAGYAAGRAAAEADAAAARDLGRGSYAVYVKPKPTPTPTPSATSGSSSSAAAAPTRPLYTGGGSPAEWMAAAGIAEGDWGYVDYIVSRESGWNPNATNKSSGACGLVQALPCSKVPGNGYDPVDNLRWGNGYAVGRYGSWAAAYNFWSSNHWW